MEHAGSWNMPDYFAACVGIVMLLLGFCGRPPVVPGRQCVRAEPACACHLCPLVRKVWCNQHAFLQTK